MTQLIYSPISIEDFARSKLKDRQKMMAASQHIDFFRKRYGKVEKDFSSTEVIRKMRDARK